MIIYDSTNPYDIPTTAEAVAGYVDGIYAWDINGWARFPAQAKIGISVNPFNQIGDALDVETGDATPSQAPAWVKARLAQGAKQLWVYVNRGNQTATEDAMAAAGIPTTAVSMWVATLDGSQSVPQYRYPIAAVQYANSTLAGGHYDLSITMAAGDAALTGDKMTPAQADLAISILYQIINLLIHGNDSFPAHDDVPAYAGTVHQATTASLASQLDALKAQLAALQQPTITVPTQITLTGSLHS